MAALSPDDYQKVRTLIYKETGMLFEEKKDYYLLSRIENRMAATGVATFKEYYNGLVFGDRLGELSRFIEAVTINETYFFRDYPQLQGFADRVLPKVAERKKAKGDKTLRVWSAACSTGEEPYSLAIILRECLDDSHDWDLHITATDIDTQVLQKAQAGLYGERSVKDTPVAYRQKYMFQVDGGYRVTNALKEMIEFQQVNLVDRLAMRRMRSYDVIFCRNVLIYFDDESRKKVISSLYDSLAPGGYLFLGHSESVGRITAAFELEKMGDFLCYKRP